MVYKIDDFGPSDLLTRPQIGVRRVKVSNIDAAAEFALNGLAYSLSGTAMVANGQSVSINISFAAKSIIKKVNANEGDRIGVYSGFSTGTSNGEIVPKNINLTSQDMTTTTSVSILNSTPQGDELSSGVTQYEPDVIVDQSSTPSVVIFNESGGNQNVFFSILFLEIGERSAALGLTPSAEIFPATEMSDYG